MTLSISVVGLGGIWVSADFRLTDATTGERRDFNSPKIVKVGYLEPPWTGLISYAGFGSIRSEETSEWIGRVLSDLPELSFDELVEVLREAGDAWLSQLPANVLSAQGGHTFSVAAMVAGQPRFAIVTNSDHLDRPQEETPCGALYVEKAQIKDRPAVFVTGIPDAVTRNERELLRREAERLPPRKMAMEEKLARINRRAAADPRWAELISEGCLVERWGPDGRGSGRTFGSAADAMPTRVMEGVVIGPESTLEAFEVMSRTQDYQPIVQLSDQATIAIVEHLKSLGIDAIRTYSADDGWQVKVSPSTLGPAREAVRDLGHPTT